MREHRPDEPHRYRLECEICGQLGMIRVSVDPERADDRGLDVEVGGDVIVTVQTVAPETVETDVG